MHHLVICKIWRFWGQGFAAQFRCNGARVLTGLCSTLMLALPTQGALIQHLDATVLGGVTTNGSGVVTEWVDQSGAGNHATPGAGSVSYPSASLSASGEPGLDFGSDENSLELFTAAESDGWLDQSAGTGGFCVLVAFRCEAVYTNNWNDLIGNSSAVGTGFGMRYSSAGSYQVYLNGNIGVGGTVADNDTIVFALNYSASTGDWVFWDSKSGSIQSGNTAAADFSTVDRVTLGSTTNPQRYFQGMVGEVKVYDNVLSASELATQRNALTAKWITVADEDPPMPNPAEWASEPAALGPFAITMAAVPGSDANNVEYFFDETSGNPGGTDSGWQISSSYTDNGLEPLTEYRYAVRMRDTLGNTGMVSTVARATTSELITRTNGPPNVVILYADDLGNADLSRNASPGSLVHTPNLDRICNEGVYLSNYMTHHVCSPSRAGLLTGRHYTEVGSGVETGGTLDNSIPNIAKDFKAAGYATGCFGKWHNGSPPHSDDGSMVLVSRKADIITDDLILQYLADQGFGEGVNAYGFDDWAGYYGGGFNYHTRLDARDINWWINGVYSAHVMGYNTYIIRDNALNFIDAHAGEPFFLYVPMEAVHAPMDILNTDLEEMCDIVDDVHPSLAWSAVKELASPTSGYRIEDVLQMRCSGGEEFDMDVLNTTLPGFKELVYYTLAYALDKSAGQILDRLDAYGLSTNTIVLFASDNGGTASNGDNFPFQGSKNTLWEGGVHVPAALWWPGHLDANQAPYTPADNNYTNMTQYIDLYPTLMAMSGQTLTATELDGLNLYSNLVTRSPARTGFDNCYYGLDQTWAAIRSDRWKLHFNRVPANQKLELYDLYGDIGESNNVQATYTAERDTLIALLDAWFETKYVTASYMPLTGESIPPYSEPAPFGDILEVTAIQTAVLSNPDSQGVYIRFATPDKDSYVHAGDVLVYDIYVAQDSDQVNGMFCSPSFGATPRFDSVRGITPDGNLLVQQTLPKGQWVRVMSGMGEIAANNSFASFIALHNPSPGYYHFYIDNLSIRREDGAVRGVAWDNGSDTRSALWYLRGGATYKTLAEALGSPGFPYSAISLSTVDLSALPVTPDPGTSYGAWAAGIGGLGSYNPTGPGPTNEWPIVVEYGLGSDPTSYTAGLIQGANPPTSGELGTYTLQNLMVDSQDQGYLTVTFDFNREANDIEIVLAESFNLIDWVDSVVLQPPYTDTGILSTNERVVEVADHLSGYPVDTTRITTRSSMALDDVAQGFLKLEVRPVVAEPDMPTNLTGNAHDGILLEWTGSLENGEFIVERAPSGSGTYTQIARTHNPLYTDTTAVVGQTYDYRVRAMNVAGATPWSDVTTRTR